MKSKPFTPNAAATELSDQALLGVLGGCDDSPRGGTSSGDLVTAETVSSANNAGSRSNPNNTEEPSSAGSSTPHPTGGANGASEREPAAGAASGSSERVPAPTDTRTAPAGTTTTSGSTTPPHGPGTSDASHAGSNDRNGHNDHESRFDEAFDEIHDGYHQILDGVKDLAHAWIDHLPEHGPIGAGFHFFSRLHDRDHGQR